MSAVVDLKGQKFGRLTVVELIDGSWIGSWTNGRWKCACDCGVTTEVLGHNLTSGNSRSCGCLRGIDLTGKRFGALVAVEMIPRTTLSTQGRSWIFRCDCGKTTIARSKDVRSGNTASCGCLQSRKGGQNHKSSSMATINQTTARVIRPKAAAAMLGVSLSTLKRMLATGRLEKVTISARAIGIPLEVITRMVEGPKPASAHAGVPVIDINRPWRKDEKIEDNWLWLVGEAALPSEIAAKIGSVLAMREQGYVTRVVSRVCRNCEHCATSVVGDNTGHVCSIGKFRVQRMGTCDKHSQRQETD